MKPVIILLAIFGLGNLLSSGMFLYAYTLNTKTTKAWIAADACLTQAEANVKHNHHPKVKSEVEATHSLYCIERARGMVK